MWPHSPPAHSRPDKVGKRAASEGRLSGVVCALCLPTSTRGNHMVRARGLVVLTVATLVAFACGGSSGGGGGSKGEIDIASDLPTQYGAAFAVEQAGSVKNFTLKFVPFDDAVNGKHDPTKGAQNVQQILSNNKLLGMVGPFNSGVAAAEIPVA